MREGVWGFFCVFFPLLGTVIRRVAALAAGADQGAVEVAVGAN